MVAQAIVKLSSLKAQPTVNHAGWSMGAMPAPVELACDGPRVRKRNDKGVRKREKKERKKC